MSLTNKKKLLQISEPYSSKSCKRINRLEKEAEIETSVLKKTTKGSWHKELTLSPLEASQC